MIRSDDGQSHAVWPKRIAWLVVLWLVGVAAVGATAIGIKLVMRLAGLTT
jgi:hypothetical protein